jgi:hypothetical protein
MFPICLCGSKKKVKLFNFENETYHQVMRNLFAAKAAVRIK